MVYRTALFSITLNTPYPFFKVTLYLDAVVTIEGEYETSSKLSNGTTLNDPDFKVTILFNVE